MSWQENENLTRSVLELGDPSALYRVRPARFFAKLGVGVSLILYGVAANYYWWVHGPKTLGHFELFLLLIVPLMGPTLLWHMYRNRGLYVLVYPTGLLRLLRGEVDSFPWGEVETVRLLIQNVAEARLERDSRGAPAACWLPVDVPMFRIWNGGLTLARADGTEVSLGPVLSAYDDLAEEVQRRTFAVLWPTVWAHFQGYRPLRFGDLEVTHEGLSLEKKFLPWREVGALVVSQGKLSIKQTGKWLPWAVKDVTGIPNPHLLFALAAEVKREREEAEPLPALQGADEDGDAGDRPPDRLTPRR